MAAFDNHRRRALRVGASGLLLVGLPALVVGVTVLPLTAPQSVPDGYSFSAEDLHDYARADWVTRHGTHVLGPFARFWWEYGLFVAGIAVLVLGIVALCLPQDRFATTAAAAVAGATGVLHAISLRQVADLTTMRFDLSDHSPSGVRGSFYDHAASGTWATIGGLAAIAIGAAALASTAGSTRPTTAARERLEAAS